MVQRHQLVHAVLDGVTLRGDQVGADAIDEATDDLVGIHPVTRCLVLDLTEDLPYGEFVEAAGEDDRGL